YFEKKLFHSNRILINVGGLKYIKNQLLLLRVFNKLKNKYKDLKDVKLVIIGEGNLRGQLEKYIQENNLKKEVYLFGFKENPFKYIAKADLFVLSSRFEGFGRVLIEAMVCNTPIVSTNCNAGPSELLDDKLLSETKIKDYKKGKWGILVNEKNEDAFVEAIYKLLNNKKLQEKYTEKAQKRANDFNLKRNADEWEKILNEK
ncbi:MAG: glycosyltransferase, partial [archaeon]